MRSILALAFLLPWCSGNWSSLDESRHAVAPYVLIHSEGPVQTQGFAITPKTSWPTSAPTQLGGSTTGSYLPPPQQQWQRIDVTCKLSAGSAVFKLAYWNPGNGQWQPLDMPGWTIDTADGVNSPGGVREVAVCVKDGSYYYHVYRPTCTGCTITGCWIEAARGPCTASASSSGAAGGILADPPFDGVGTVLDPLTLVLASDGSLSVSAGAIGVGSLASDSQHGALSGGSLHALAIASGAAGFLSGTEKAALAGTSGSAIGSSNKFVDNADPRLANIAQGTTTTIDATPTTIATFTPSDGQSGTVSAIVTARKSDGSDSGHWRVECGFMRAAGAAVLQGVPLITTIDSLSSAEPTCAASGGSILLRAVGVAATNLAWGGRELIVLSS